MGLLDDAIREHLDLKRRRGADPAEVARAEQEALGPVRRAPVEDAEAEASSNADLAHSQQEDDLAYDREDGQGWDEPLVEGADAGPGGPEFDHRPPASEEPTRMYDAPEATAGGSRLEGDELPPEAPGRSQLERDEPPAALGRSQLAPEEHDDPFAQEYERDSFTVPDSDDPVTDEDHQPPHRAITPAPHPAPASPMPSRPPGDHVGQETAEYQVEGGPDEEREDVLEETPEFLQDTPDHDRLWFEQRPPRDFDFDG